MMSNYQKIREALSAHAPQILDYVASNIAYLGAKMEWSMEDNFETTEGLVRLASQVGLPGAGSQTVEALAFYREAAVELGFDPEEDLDYDPEESLGEGL